MLRDKIKDKAYFDENIDFNEETIEEYIDDLKNDANLSIEAKMKFSFRIIDYTVTLMHQRYSRGDNLSDLKSHLETALEYRSWQKHYADLLPPKEQKNRIGWEEIREDYLESWLDWLAFSYCLNMGQNYYQKVFDLMANQGLDALFDKVAIEMGDVNRSVSDTLLFKKRFKKLYNVIEAEPAKRPYLMKNYLDAWYKLIDSPDFHLMDNDSYDGYWSMESALITKLYNIDDSIYIDHDHYPKDLVHWQEQSS